MRCCCFSRALHFRASFPWYFRHGGIHFWPMIVAQMYDDRRFPYERYARLSRDNWIINDSSSDSRFISSIVPSWLFTTSKACAISFSRWIRPRVDAPQSCVKNVIKIIFCIFWFFVWLIFVFESISCSSVSWMVIDSLVLYEKVRLGHNIIKTATFSTFSLFRSDSIIGERQSNEGRLTLFLLYVKPWEKTLFSVCVCLFMTRWVINWRRLFSNLRICGYIVGS